MLVSLTTHYLNASHHSSYVNLRTWRVFTLADPDCGLPPQSNPFGDDYPFSLKVPKDKLLSVQDMMQMQVRVFFFFL